MDYYKLLNVSKEASDSEIKKSYRKLAKENHPDKGGDPEKFKQIMKHMKYCLIKIKEPNMILSVNMMEI